MAAIGYWADDLSATMQASHPRLVRTWPPGWSLYSSWDMSVRHHWSMPSNPADGDDVYVPRISKEQVEQPVGEAFGTARLLLRPITLLDVDLLVELDSDPEVMRYLTGRPSTRTEVEATVQERLGSLWVATEKVTSRFVGWFGLVPGPDQSYSLGYRLGRNWWGQGLATEGSMALMLPSACWKRNV
jgi:hypothetical protein